MNREDSTISRENRKHCGAQKSHIDHEYNAGGDGAKAYFAGFPISDNPYTQGTWDHEDWRDGWINARAERLRHR